MPKSKKPTDYQFNLLNIAALLYGYSSDDNTPDREVPIFNVNRSDNPGTFRITSLKETKFFKRHFGDDLLEQATEKKTLTWDDSNCGSNKITEFFKGHGIQRTARSEEKCTTDLRKDIGKYLKKSILPIETVYTKNLKVIEEKNILITNSSVRRLRIFIEKSRETNYNLIECSEGYTDQYFNHIVRLLNENSETPIEDFAKALTMILIGALLRDQTEEIVNWFENILFSTAYKHSSNENSIEDIPPVYASAAESERIVIKDLTKIKYKQSYTANLFLNNSETGRPAVTLNDVYQMPVYENDYVSPEEEQTFDSYFDAFIKGDITGISSQLLTIVGQPGSGKSSLIKHILNDDKLLSILLFNGFQEIIVHRFSELSNNLPWNLNNIELPKQLLSDCGISINASGAGKKKLLILDGFDEIDIPGSTEGRTRIINLLTKSMQKISENIYIVITCRDQYLDYKDLDNYVVLCPLTESQIKTFIEKYNACIFSAATSGTNNYFYDIDELEKLLDSEKKQKNSPSANGSVLSSDIPEHNKFTDILSIPLILYMVTALKIEFSDKDKTNSITDVYDQIFNIKGGIFDHYNFLYDEEQTSLFQENTALMENYRKELLLISHSISRKMFLLKPSKAEISNQLYLKLIDEAAEKIVTRTQNIQSDKVTLIEKLSIYMKGNNFLRYLEGSDGLYSHYFVHRSMYEYFLSCWIYDRLKNILEPDSRLSTEGISLKKSSLSELLQLLSARPLSIDIRKHLSRKIDSTVKKACKFKSQEVSKVRKSWLDSWMEIFVQYLDTDFYSTKNNEKLSDSSLKNSICFLNCLSILQILHCLNKADGCEYICFPDSNLKTLLNQYIREALFNKTHASNDHICYTAMLHPNDNAEMAEQADLKTEPSFIQEINLEYLDLDNHDFSFHDFSGVNLSNCSLKQSVFHHCSLKNMRIHHSVFTGSDFFNANLSLLNAEHCNFDGCNFRKTSLEFSKIYDSSFIECHMEDSNLFNSDISGSYFCSSDLSGANLEYTIAKGCDFTNTILYNANFDGTDLSDATFTDAKKAKTSYNNEASKRIGASFEDCITSNNTVGL